MIARLARLILGATLVLACLLWGARPALAHANLVRSEPAASSVLDESPGVLRLWFSEAPEPRFSEVTLRDRDGRVLEALGPIRPSPADPTELTASVRPLAGGVYTAVWRVTSAVDGHVTTGSIVFVVGRDQVPAEGLLPASAGPPDSSSPTPLALLTRWLGYAASALLVGGFAFYPLVLRPSIASVPVPTPPTPSGRRRKAGVRARGTKAARSEPSAAQLIALEVGVGLGALATALAAVLQAASGAGVDLLTAIGPPLRTLLLDTRAGALLLARLALLSALAGLLYVGGRSRSPGPAWWWVGFGLSVIAAATLSLGSHAAASPAPLVSTVADWLHLVAASAWLGGLAALGLTLARASRLPDEVAPGVVARLVGHFSRLGVVCVAVVAVTGVYRSLVEVGDLGALSDTAYGRALVMKLALIVPVVGLAATNLLVIGRRLRQAAASPDPGSASRPWHARIRQSVGGEVLLLSAVLLATSVLASVPPAREAYGAGIVLRGNGPDLHSVLVVSPGEVGLNTFQAYLRDAAGQPIDDALKVSLIFSATNMDMGVAEAEAQSAGNGRYLAQGGYLSMDDSWRVELLVRRPGLDDVRIPFSVDVKSPLPRFGDSPAPPDPAAQARGQQVYAANCAVCHGPSGRGDGPAAPTLRPAPADFRVHMAMGHTDQELFDFVANGIPPAMPAFRDSLSEQERRDVVAYLHTFAPTAGQRPAAATPQPGASPAASRSTSDVPTRLPESLARTGAAAIAWNERIWASDDSGAFRSVAALPTGGQFLGSPAWSPDGQRIAHEYVGPAPTPVPGQPARSQIPAAEIWTVDLAGKWQALVARDGPEVSVSQPAWQPDGAAIYYTRQEIRTEQGLVVGSTRRIERFTLGSGQRQTIVEDASWPAVSPDGKQLAYVRGSDVDPPSLWLLDLATGRRTRLSDQRFIDVSSPSFSPDGRTVAFAGVTEPETMRVAPADADGLLDRLGRWIAPRAEAHGIPYGLWLVEVGGASLRRIGDLAFDAPVVRWEANGSRLLVADETGLHQVDVAAATQTPLMPLPYSAGFDWRAKGP